MKAPDKDDGNEELYEPILTKDKSIFGRICRLNLLTELINQSVSKKLYNITYEITKRFMSDLLKAQNLPIFEILFNHFEKDTTRYEAKCACLMRALPLMNRKIATKFMKIIEGVLNEPANNHVLKMNINPLRTGLMLFRVIHEVSDAFGYSPGTTQILKDQLTE